MHRPTLPLPIPAHTTATLWFHNGIDQDNPAFRALFGFAVAVHITSDLGINPPTVSVHQGILTQGASEEHVILRRAGRPHLIVRFDDILCIHYF